MSLPRVLVVEDDASQRLLIEKALSTQFEVLLAENYAEGRRRIEGGQFDLVLLDVMLDEADGFQLCTMMRANERLRFKPLIFLTSLAETAQKVTGFTLGADDYIVKPCDPLELRARVQAKLTRVRELEAREQSVTVNDLIFRLDQQSVEVQQDGRTVTIELTPLEFKLTYFLARHQGQVLSRDQILAHVWGRATNVLDRTVDTFIAAVRKKLGSRGRYIRSVHGVGYKFVAALEEPRKAS